MSRGTYGKTTRLLAHLGVVSFYSSAAFLAMQSDVLAIVDLSVRPSVTFRSFVHRNEDTIMRSSVSGSTMILVSGEVKFIRTFTEDYPQQER